MIIGIDMDDVLVEYVKSFLEFYNERNKTNLSYGEFTNISNSVDKNNSFFRSDYFKKMEICDGVKMAIKELAKKHDLFIVTSRQIEWKEATDKFIQENFPNCFRGIFYSADIHGGGRKKTDIYDGMKVIIEDNRGHALECAKNGMKVFLLKKPWNRGIDHPNIIQVDGWREILEIISNGE